MTRLKIDRAILNLFLMWLAWAIILNGYQHFVVSRFQLARPDNVLPWTAKYTNGDAQTQDSPFSDFYRDLRVAWDSGYYLSIATSGYDDPRMSAIQTATGERVTLNYAFLPLYPLLIKLVAILLQPLQLAPALAPIYAGVLISLLGALAAVFALYDLSSKDGHAQDEGTRAAFYMLVFPTGFFLAQVYTEGLFVGLAFSCLALIKRKQWLWASLLATLATLTRTVGVGLAIPLAIALLNDLRTEWLSRRRISWTVATKLLLTLAPVIAFLVWLNSPLGKGFSIVEENNFGRHPLAFSASWNAWSSVVSEFAQGNRIRTVYYGIEFAGIGLALIACIGTLRHHFPIALFGLFVLITSLTSAVPQSMIRYMLVVPSIYIFLSQLGRNQVFDRVWILTSVLFMGILLMLFTFDMWVG